jgi:hypothetical protein
MLPLNPKPNRLAHYCSEHSSSIIGFTGRLST